MFLLCLGCENKSKVDKPDDLISKEEMSNIMYEMFIISSSKGSSVTLLRDNGIQPDIFILSKHGIDSIDFVNSNNYYAHDIVSYNKILKSVKDRLETEKARIQNLVDKEKEIIEEETDSIRMDKKQEILNDKKKREKLKKYSID